MEEIIAKLEAEKAKCQQVFPTYDENIYAEGKSKGLELAITLLKETNASGEDNNN